MSEQLKKQIVLIEKEGNNIKVKNEKDFIAASDYQKANKLIQKRVAELLDPNIKNLHAAHRSATTQKKELLAPLINSEKKVGSQIGLYLAEKEKIRLAIQHQEQRAAVEAANKKAEMLKDLGFENESKMVLEDPIINPAKIQNSTPKTGVSLKKDFTFEIIDATQIKGDFLIPDEQKIRRIVKTLGQNAVNIVGGIRVIETFGSRTRIK